MYKLIAFATHWGSKYGGINCFNHDLLSAVGTKFKEDFKVFCVVTEASDHEHREAEKTFVTLVPLPYLPDSGRLSLDTAQIVIQELENKKLVDAPDDIVWLGHDSITGEIALAVKSKLGGSTALIHHMSYDLYESFSEDSATAQEKKKKQKLLFLLADVRLAVGPLLRDALIDLVHDDNVCMLVPGLAPITPCHAPKNFSAFMSGRLDSASAKIKQGYLGVAAFAQFSSKIDGFRPKLVLRGVNYEDESLPSNVSLPNTETELKKFAERFANAAINLYALPYTHDRELLFKELANSTVAMMPSWHEGFGLGAWEAIAAGVPVILGRDSGVYKLLTEDEHLLIHWTLLIQGSNSYPYFTDNDLSQLEKHLMTIYSNPQKEREKAKILRTKLVSKYTWAACAENIVDSFGWNLSTVRIAVAHGAKEVINTADAIHKAIHKAILADKEERRLKELKRDEVTQEIFQLLKQVVQALKSEGEFSNFSPPSNISPESQALRKQVREAINQQNTQVALLLMKQVNEVEARKEEEAFKAVVRQDDEARNARKRVQAQSILHAKTQVEYSSLLYSVGKIDEAITLCKSAISRLPDSEANLREHYSKRLRSIMNVKGHLAADMKTARESMFDSPLASVPDVFSFNILSNKAPDYETARSVLSEMDKAKIKPDVVTFSTLMANAPDYETARSVLSEMDKAKIKPNVVTFSTLMANAPNYETARSVLSEMDKAEIKPDVVTFSTLMANAPDYETARSVLSEMDKAEIKPNVVTFNTLMANAPNYETARSVLSEMDKAKIKPNVVTFSTLMANAPDYETARSVLSEMDKAEIKPNVVTTSTAARYVNSPEQANELRQAFRELNTAGTQFHRAIFSRFCRFMSGKEILDWAFSDGGGVPFPAFDAAVAGFFRLGKFEDALRIASAFPYLDVCRNIFRIEPEKSKKYLSTRFARDEEPHNAAYALALYYEEQGAFNEALHWLDVSQDHPETGDKKKLAIQEDITRIRGRIDKL